MIITGGVRCQFWDRSEPIEVEVPDTATEEEIEEAIRDAALEMAKFEYWRD